MERNITDSENIQTACDALKATLYLSMGASVVAYYPKTRTADVQPMQTDPRTDLETGATIWEAWPIITGVPVLWPRFGGGAGKPSIILAGTLNQGDQVVMEAFDLDPSTWIAQGRSLKPVNPAHIRRLGGNHWRINPSDIVSPAVGLSSSTPEPGTTSAFLIGPDGSSQQIVFYNDGSISIGASPEGFLALADLVKNELTAIKNTLGSLTGAASFTTPYAGPGNIATTVAKAK